MGGLNHNVAVPVNRSSVFKFLSFSLFGIFMFFISVNINGKTTIPLDHIVTLIKSALESNIQIYIVCAVSAGAIYPFYKKTWNKSAVSKVFTVLKIMGALFTYLIYFKTGPSWLIAQDMGPLVISVLIAIGVIIPVGSLFLTFLVDYGLLEFIGVLMQPVMRPVFKTPGRSSMDAVASTVASYSISLLITNKGFREGKYTIKEAAIIATGFSMVSATFMIVICKTLGMMDIWNFYFWSAIAIKFIVTAITARLLPLSRKPDKYFENKGQPDTVYKGNLVKIAFKEGVSAAGRSKNIGLNVLYNFKYGLTMAMNILPTGAAFAVIGLVLSKNTPFFDYLGYIFYPFFKMFEVPEALLAGKATALSLAECFIAVLLVSEAALITKYIIGVIVVSEVIMFAGPVPCMMATDIPFTIPELVVIWFERTILTIIFAGMVGTIFI